MTRQAFLASIILVGIVMPPHPGRAQGNNAPAPYVLVTKSAKRIKAGLTIEVKAPRVLADEWTVYVPQIPALPGQVDVLTTLSPQGTSARERSDAARAMLYVRIPVEDESGLHGVKALVDYEATLLERRLERREPGAPEGPAVATLDAKTRRVELANHHHFDHQSARFRDWLKEHDLRRKPDENDVDFARRAFLAVRKGVKFTEGKGIEHAASRVCEAGKSDFVGITAVYVAALRANGIPARSLAGRAVIFEGKPAKECWPHARAEFYAKGVGWVPADVAGAIRFNKTDDGLESFGNDNADFLTLHLDTDLLVDTYFGVRTLETLFEPSWWVKGSGGFDGCEAKVNMTVRVEPVDLAEVLARKTSSPRPAAKKSAGKGNRPPS